MIGVAGAGLDPNAPMTFTVTSDGPTELRLSTGGVVHATAGTRGYVVP